MNSKGTESNNVRLSLVIVGLLRIESVKSPMVIKNIKDDLVVLTGR